MNVEAEARVRRANPLTQSDQLEQLFGEDASPRLLRDIHHRRVGRMTESRTNEQPTGLEPETEPTRRDPVGSRRQRQGGRTRSVAIAAAVVVVIIGTATTILAFGSDGGNGVATPSPTTTEAVPTIQSSLITSFEDIAGRIYQIQGSDAPAYFYFFEDGTWHISSSQGSVENSPNGILETRFEGTKVFLTNIRGACGGPDEAIYEIGLLENGNLQVVLIEDTCTFRSNFFVDEWAPVP
jgi:hypothetical protein